MRGVDHDPLRFAALARQFGENLVEHPQAAPANKPIVDCLVRAIVARSVAPTQPVLDHKHDRADDPPIVHPRDPMRERKIPFKSDASELVTAKTNQPWRSLPTSAYESANLHPSKNLIGPEPSSLGSAHRLEEAVQ